VDAWNSRVAGIKGAWSTPLSAPISGGQHFVSSNCKSGCLPGSGSLRKDAELASRRAAGAHARARRAAEKAALTLAESARLHERVANLQQRDDDKAAKAAAERDRRDAAQKRREAAAEWWRQPFTADS